MFIKSGTGGLYDYWQNVSYGSLNLDGSVVKGWYTEPFTLAQSQSRNRTQRFQDCIDAARNSPTNPYTVPDGQLVAVITSPDVDLFGIPNVGAFLPASVDVGAMGHEVGHGLGLNHSFSDDPTYRNADWAQIGEYDDQWDLMSYANVFSTTTSSFGNGGPGLNVYHRDRMGWLPLPRIFTFGADGAGTQTLTLAALNHPEVPGFLQVRVPFDPADTFHYYTIEFRRNDGWDAGFPDKIVIIHEVKRGADGQYYSYLLRSHSGNRVPVQSLNANGVSITVNATSAQTNQATVSISGNIADRCLQGYVWRESSPSDHVCVPPDTRTQTWSDNAQAGARRSPNGGSFGPDTCLQGYVWREAFPGDHVCVPSQTRSQVQADNAQAAARRNPARLVYGPNTCKQGYVWREADSSDYVCVPPNTRTQTWNDNAQAGARRSPNGGSFGPDTCLQGFVWREAFPGDHVCVSPPVRTQAQADNRQAGSHLMKP